MAMPITNFHMQYLDITSQHWHPNSEAFAGCDHLLTALNRGWEIDACIEVKHEYAAMRGVRVYHFKLVRRGETMTMPVVNNPYVERLILQNQLEVQTQH